MTVKGCACSDDNLLLLDYKEKISELSAKRYVTSNIKFNIANAVATRKDESKAFFNSYQLTGSLQEQYKRMVQAGKQGVGVPRWWAKLSKGGKRQRRTTSNTEAAITSCRECLGAESRLLAWVVMRSDEVVSRVLEGGKGDTMGEEEEVELEAQFNDVVDRLDVKFAKRMGPEEKEHWESYKKKIHIDLFYLRPLAAENLKLEEDEWNERQEDEYEDEREEDEGDEEHYESGFGKAFLM